MPAKPIKTRAAAAAASASVVKADFKSRYAEHDGSCGDQLATKLKAHVSADDGTVDLAKLKALAVANGIWRSDYAKLNAGLARMSVSNRLRALERNGGKVKWGRGRRAKKAEA